MKTTWRPHGRFMASSLAMSVNRSVNTDVQVRSHLRCPQFLGRRLRSTLTTLKPHCSKSGYLTGRSHLSAPGPCSAIDDKAEFQESESTALKPTLPVADWNALEAGICLRKRIKSGRNCVTCFEQCSFGAACVFVLSMLAMQLASAECR